MLRVVWDALKLLVQYKKLSTAIGKLAGIAIICVLN